MCRFITMSIAELQGVNFTALERSYRIFNKNKEISNSLLSIQLEVWEI